MAAGGHAAHLETAVFSGVVFEDNLVGRPHLEGFADRAVLAFGIVQEIQVQLVTLVAAIGIVFFGRGIAPVAAVQDLDDGNGQSHFGQAVQQEAAVVEVDGRDRRAVLVIGGPAELVIFAPPGADMVSVVVRGNEVVQLASGYGRGEMLDIVHDHLSAVDVDGGPAGHAGGTRSIIGQLVRRGAGGIDQHRGSVGEDVVKRLSASAVDGMDIHISLCPGRHDLTHFELFCVGGFGGRGDDRSRSGIVLPAAARKDHGERRPYQ